jgi:phosphoglycerol transferase MdoB-like AlkP superfamily enzyme
MERKCFIRAIGIINYQIFDIYNYIRTKFDMIFSSQSDMTLKEAWLQEMHSTRTINNLKASGQSTNLILIQIESLQNFVIGMQWEGHEITPNLNRLAQTGIHFNNLYDQTWAGNTSDATFMANCSLYPSKRGAVSFLYAQNTYYCLPQILREHDYTTATMHAFRSAFWNRAIFEKALGYQRQFYEDKYLKEDLLGWGLSDKRFFAQSIEKIKALPSPFYALLTTLTSHVPFDDVTATIDNFPLGNLEGKLIGNYLRSMHYVDSAIGEFLQKLSANNLMSKTIIAIYGDHRARFEENDLKMVGITDMDELRKIPVIISLPNWNSGSRIDTIGGLIDFAPTISSILGLDISNTVFLGKDLMNQNNHFVIFRDGSYITKDTQLDKDYVLKQLSISDLIMEKDLMKTIKNNKS